MAVGLSPAFASTSSMWKLSRSGEDMGSVGAYSDCSLHIDSAGYGSLALRQVASRASFAWLWFGAQPTDETEEIDDAREERELSETMDSGEDERDEFEGAREGRRLGK
jgi:hypothetical protein